MRHIDTVFGHVLDAAPDIPFGDFIFAPVRIGGFGEMLHFPLRRGAVGMVPEHQPAIGLGDRPLVRARALDLWRNRLGIGNFADHAGFIITPGVKRALEVIAIDLAAIAHMGTKMPAIGIEHARLAILAAPDDQIAAEIAQRLDLADGEFARQQRRIPAEGIGYVEPAFSHRRPALRFRQPPGFQRIALQAGQHLPHGHRRGAGIVDRFRHGQSSNPKTRMALPRRNLGQTSALKGTFGMSPKIRSRLSPIGK